MVRAFLACAGTLYLILAGWCALNPVEAARTVGLQMVPGSGQSEFLTVYGGLEAGLGVMLLLPLFWPGLIRSALINSTVIHGCLLAFRGAGFLLFSGISATTRNLAVGECLLFLLSGILLFTYRGNSREGSRRGSRGSSRGSSRRSSRRSSGVSTQVESEGEVG